MAGFVCTVRRVTPAMKEAEKAAAMLHALDGPIVGSKSVNVELSAETAHGLAVLALRSGSTIGEYLSRRAAEEVRTSGTSGMNETAIRTLYGERAQPKS